MNRQQYAEARRLLRENGAYAFRWLQADVCRVMTRLKCAESDPLATRAWLLRDFGRPMLWAEMRHTARNR